jgi:hypothetical protein
LNMKKLFTVSLLEAMSAGEIFLYEFVNLSDSDQGGEVTYSFFKA